MYQGAHHSFARARAALKYIVLALSGVMDDILVKYKVIFWQDFCQLLFWELYYNDDKY